MKKTLLAITISSCFLFACNNSDDSKSTASDIASDSSLQTGVPTLQEAAPAGGEATGQSSSGNTTTSFTVPANAAPGTPTAAGMNPPHGQPGHRCEIAVGAPLNSAPGTPAANPAISPSTGSAGTPVVSSPLILNPSSPSTSPSITTAPAVPTAPGMNPPHGQPGHDCAIAVGAPLKK